MTDGSEATMTDRASRVLVVDDDPTNRLKMGMAVNRLGLAVTTADNGQQALAILGQTSHDLVLLDIMMPEMDGYELLSIMKSDSKLRDIPVLMISALDDLDAVVKAIKLGAEDHLPKSFDSVLLQARIGACLEKKRLRDQETEYLRQVEKLTSAAALIESDGFDPGSLSLDELALRQDALGQLARVFVGMAAEVYSREQQLKSRVQQLEIEIDRTRQERHVNSITGTDYFRELRERAGSLRGLLHDSPSES